MQISLKRINKILICDLSSILLSLAFKAKARYSNERAYKAVLDDILVIISSKLSDQDISHVVMITYDINNFKTNIDWLEKLNNTLLSKLNQANISCLNTMKNNHLNNVFDICNNALDSGYKLIVVGDELLYFSLLARGAIIYKNGNELIDESYILKRYGISSNKIIDMIALTGSVDNGIASIADIHEKDAVELISKFGCVTSILDETQKLPLKIRSKTNALRNNYNKIKDIVNDKNSSYRLDLAAFSLLRSTQDTLDIIYKNDSISEGTIACNCYKTALQTSSKLALKFTRTDTSILDRLDLANTITNDIISKYIDNSLAATQDRIAYIYALSDPRNSKDIRYIGKTANIDNRLTQHINTASPNGTLKEQWISTLLSENFVPHITILKRIIYKYDFEWSDLEQYYIRHYFEIGFNLLNDSIGGIDYSHIESNDLLFELLCKNIKNRLLVWDSYKSKLNEVGLWNTLSMLSKIKSVLFNSNTCKYCGVYKITQSHQLSDRELIFTDIYPYKPITYDKNFNNEKQLHDVFCTWWHK